GARPAMPCWRRALLCCPGLADPVALRLEAVEEPVDHAALPRLVGERLADDPARQLGGQRPDLGPKRDQRLLPLRLDLGLRGLGDPAGLGLGALTHLGDDLRALLTGFLAHARGLVLGVLKLGAVLREHRLRLGLSLVGPVNAALDRVFALAERLDDPR